MAYKFQTKWGSALQREAQHEVAREMAQMEAKAMAEGRTEGEARVILRQIGSRFGLPDAGLQARIAALPTETLEALAVDLLALPDGEALTLWLDAHAPR